MSHKLSIVMPCYNARATLEEALASTYTQHLTIPYEVIMVDDGSTDGTRDLIVELSKKYPNIIYFFHEKNKGGGATRNTGIKKATGDLIYCLDSDNFFAPDTLQKMIDCLDKNNADGVAFYERKFFAGNNKEKYRSQIAPFTDRPVTLQDIFTKEAVLLDNFLYTKKSYLETAGYPENHGFDTQCFELRYISAGHKVYFAPETIFYHRQGLEEKSYFERVYESGDFSKNMYLIYEDIFYLFSSAIQKIILDYNIFKKNTLGENNIGSTLQRAFDADPQNFFIPEYKKYLKPHGFAEYIKDHPVATSETEIFCRTIFDYKQGKYEQAIEQYKKLAKEKVSNPIMHYNIMRNMVALGGSDTASTERSVNEMLESMHTSKQKISLHASIIKRIINKLYATFNDSEN